MDLITLDFETFYANDFTLSRMTTEEYIRDPRFETIMCGFKVNDQKSYWVDGPDVRQELHKLEVDANSVLCHHAHFDGLILSHHYGVRPKVWLDTLSMARAFLGQKVPMGLGKLAERFGVGHKGHEVEDAKGKRRSQFSGSQLQRYGGYCCNDIDLTYDIFHKMIGAFSKGELKIIDMVIRMFTEPMFVLNRPLLEDYALDLRADKSGALLQAGVQLTDVMSNDKFAAALEALGVMPPTKISPTTGKETWAFAKTDKAMEALAEHPDDLVQLLVAARLKNKTTIAETRAIRMIGMSQRGSAPVYLKYSGAEQTHRLSGGDKMNWQNMGRGGKIRDAVEAPDGQVCVVGDSSNIEARVLCWLACQDDAIRIFDLADKKLGPDVYCTMAERIYNRPINKKDHPAERQLGKTAVLGLGYGMGGAKFVQAVRTMAKQIIDETTAKMVVDIYRSTHPKVVELWKRAETALGHIAKGNEGIAVDERGIVRTTKQGLMLPNGLEIKFPDLQHKPGRGEDSGWSYWDGRARSKIYGGKVVENIIQALARIVVMDQTVQINKYLPVGLSVHDEAVAVTDEDDGPDALQFVEDAMRVRPTWAPDLPLNSEGGFHNSYGKAKT